MMRAFFISASVLAVIYLVVAIGIANEVKEARWRSLESTLNDYYGDSYGAYGYDYSYADYSSEADEATRMGGIASVFFMLVSTGAFVLALMKIRTKTMKVISIIGLSISGLFLLWAMLPMATPDHISFDEIVPAFLLAALALLGFHIVGIVHAFKTST